MVWKVIPVAAFPLRQGSAHADAEEDANREHEQHDDRSAAVGCAGACARWTTSWSFSEPKGARGRRSRGGSGRESCVSRA